MMVCSIIFFGTEYIIDQPSRVRVLVGVKDGLKDDAQGDLLGCSYLKELFLDIECLSSDMIVA
jgi:hypothetical protein